MSEIDQQLLRHYLATISYRGSIVLSDVPDHYPDFQIGDGVRSPLEILAHISDVLTSAYSYFIEIDRNHEIGSWEQEIVRFHTRVDKLDQLMAQNIPFRDKTQEQLLQGPFSDVMTHIGQLAMLRRLAGSPVRGQRYSEVDIQIGKGRSQVQ